jgi:RNA polymerase sigma-70 factor (ECF subfamily)
MSRAEHEQLFHQWLQDHSGILRKVVRAFTQTAQDREDLLQEVLVQLWSSLPRFRGEAKASTWIYRVAFNTALAWKRESKHLKTLVSLSGIDPPAETSHPETLACDPQIERLYAAIRQLPGIDASLALMHLDGLSYQEMAAVVGISENHVGVKLTRIRHQLARSLQGDQHDL